MKGRSAENKKMWIKAISVTLAMLLSTHIKGPMPALAADAIGVKLPYEQTWTTERRGAEPAVQYELTAEQGSPVPMGADNGGIYHFTLYGNAKGDLDLRIPYDSPGFYSYHAKCVPPAGVTEYIYPKEEYKVTILVTYAEAGMAVSNITIERSAAEKSDSMKFTADVKQKDNPGGGGGGPSGGGGDPGKYTPGTIYPVGDNEPPETVPETTASVLGAARDRVRNTVTAVAQTAQDVLGADRDPAEPETSSAAEPEPEPETEPETEPEVIEEPPVPLAPPKEEVWSLFNLLCATATIIIEAAALILINKRKKEEDEEQNDRDVQAAIKKAHDEDRKWEKPENWRKRRNIRIGGLVPAAISAIAFLITQDVTRKMVWFDKYSVWMGLLLAVTVGMTFAGRAQDDSEEVQTDSNGQKA